MTCADAGQLDYCPGGEVFSYLRRARRFNEPTSQFYAAEIVLILEFLHEKEGVAYRDLKPENILIDAEGHLKLVDFGFAKKVENRGLRLKCHLHQLADFDRGNLHVMRDTRVSGTGGHQKYRYVVRFGDTGLV
jgi:serine/threonine protein kinase